MCSLCWINGDLTSLPAKPPLLALGLSVKFSPLRAFLSHCACRNAQSSHQAPSQLGSVDLDKKQAILQLVLGFLVIFQVVSLKSADS